MLQKLSKTLRNFWVIASLICLPLPLLAGGVEEEKREYWLCEQMGHVDNNGYVYAISDVFRDNEASYEEVQVNFEDAAVDQYESYEPLFMPRCWSYSDPNQAKKNRIKKVKLAEKREVSVLYVFLKK